MLRLYSLSLKEVLPMEKSMKRFYELLSNSTIFVMFAVAAIFVTHTTVPANALIVQPNAAALMAQKIETYSKATELSDCQLVEVLSIAGFNNLALRKAWAVSKTESNGRPLAFNGNKRTGDHSYGIFQVNMLGYLGVERRDKYNLTSDSKLFNPILNADVVYRMSNGGKDWSSWSSYGTVRYKKFLEEFPTKCLTMQKA
jgi:hypothetical protein